MIADEDESREERWKRLDLICRNVMDGIVNSDDLLIDDMIAVMLRMKEIAEEMENEVVHDEQKLLNGEEISDP